MTALFSSPKVKTPQVEAPPPVPTIDNAQLARNETNRLRQRRGVDGNLFAGALGLTTGGGTGGKTTTGGA